MSLTLHFHPLASYCHKVLIALYENGTPFTPNMVDLANETERAARENLALPMWAGIDAATQERVVSVIREASTVGASA